VRARLISSLVAAVGIAVGLDGTAASASAWVVHLVAGSHGEATARGLPAAPGSPAAGCVSPTGTQITVTWSSIPLATSYKIWQSTTSSGSGYSVTASGVTGTSWTSASLANANYWYKVSAVIGSNWASAQSVATGETTIQSGGTTCVQP